MLTEKDITELLEGCALLESTAGNLYEYTGSKDGKLFFQNVNDDSHLELTYDQLRKNKYFDIQY